VVADAARPRLPPPSGHRRALEVTLLALVVGLFCAPMFATPGGFVSGDPYRSHDWLIAATHDAMARDAILRHGQLPLRSHLVGGGYPTLGHPSDGALSPFVLPSLVLGERLGLRINLVIALLLGTLGVYRLAGGVLGLGGHGPLLAALAFAVAGWHPSRVLVGYYESTFFLLFPLMLDLMLRASRGFRALALGAFLTAACFMQVMGGAVAFLIWAGGHLLLGTGRRVLGVSRRRLVLAAVATLLLAGALGAVKSVPMMHLLAVGRQDRMPDGLLAAMPLDPVDRWAYTHSFPFYLGYLAPAIQGNPDYFYPSLSSLVRGLTHAVRLRATYHHLPGGVVQPEQPEYPFINVGWPVLLLAGLAGLLRLRPVRGNLVMLLLATWVCFGFHAPVDLFRALSYLPVVSGLSRPVQYFNFFILLELVLVAGAAVAWIEGKLVHRWARALVLGALCLALLPTALTNTDRYRQAFSTPLPDVARVGRFYQVRVQNPALREQAAVGYANTYLNILRGVGSILWDSNIKLPERARPRYLVDSRGVRALADGYRGEVFISRGHGEVRGWRITPLVVEARLRLAGPAIITINQNQDPAWRCSTPGCAVVSRQGVLRVRCRRGGEVKLRLVYSPWWFWEGLGGSLLGLAVLVLVWRTRARWWPGGAA